MAERMALQSGKKERNIQLELHGGRTKCKGWGSMESHNFKLKESYWRLERRQVVKIKDIIVRGNTERDICKQWHGYPRGAGLNVFN
jgi:glutamine phosphoribosylpyrophosphate amidotransferase